MSTTTVYLELDDGSTYEARLVFHPRLALERVIAIDLALGVPAVRKALHVLVTGDPVTGEVLDDEGEGGEQ